MKTLMANRGLIGALVCSLLWVTAPSAAQTRDKWVVSASKNPMNDKPIVTATLRANIPAEGWLVKATPMLVVRCQTPLEAVHMDERLPFQPGLDVYIATGMPASVENGEGIHTIHVRFDDDKSRGWGTHESNDKKALFIAPAFATQMILTDELLLKSKRMLVQFTPFNATPVIIQFDTEGFEKHASSVLAACPPVDRSKWLLLRRGSRE